MNYKILSFFLFFCLFSCNDNTNGTEEKILQWISSNPVDGSEDVSASTTSEIVLTYDQNIAIASMGKITLNGKTIAGKVSVSDKDLKIQIRLEEETEYRLIVPAGVIQMLDEAVFANEVVISFHTKKEILPEFAPLVTKKPSPEAVNLYEFLKENYGKKIISGTVANVSWNTNEADWVYQHTGKYPALNAFDYIHLYASPSGWINYENTSIVEDWWNNKGIVAALWHWNVPRSQGSNEYAFYTEQTAFDISKAIQEGTYENGVIKADLEKIADNLLLLKQKNIPVLWRPLHEAAGGWFWWGAKGAQPCKELWKIMFNYFQERGLNNLIWIWTAEPNDDAWYPGDEYVDIVGRDIYHKNTADQLYQEYQTLKNRYPGKIITLSECGDVAGVTQQLKANANWSWFMTWYDYNRTRDAGSAAFKEEGHEHANAGYWRNAFADSQVITRDQMPVLK
jgi:mannan endo-1,4-beta-mannosidase